MLSMLYLEQQDSHCEAKGYAIRDYYREVIEKQAINKP